MRSLLKGKVPKITLTRRAFAKLAGFSSTANNIPHIDASLFAQICRLT